MPYLSVGDGPVPLALIPGAGDGMRAVYDWAEPTAWALRGRATHYRTRVISRREPLPVGYTAEQHAEDYVQAKEDLRWELAILACNPGGGPSGQRIALKRPDLVRALIYSSTRHPLRHNLLMIGAHIAWGITLGVAVWCLAGAQDEAPNPGLVPGPRPFGIARY